MASVVCGRSDFRDLIIPAMRTFIIIIPLADFPDFPEINDTAAAAAAAVEEAGSGFSPGAGDSTLYTQSLT